MIIGRDLHPEFSVITSRRREILARLLDGLTGREVEITAGDLSAERGRVYRVLDGLLKVTRHGRVVWYYEALDLVGLDLQFWFWDVVISAEEPTRCCEYDFKAILEVVAASPENIALWTEYLALEASLAHSALSVTLRDEVDTQPTIKAVRGGETIVAQGEVADKVYTLLEGRADVLVDGVKVGEVLRDEIFGALAAFSGGPRTASVVTSENCLVLALPREQFASLVESRPRLVVKLIEDVARAISSLNARVAQRY